MRPSIKEYAEWLPELQREVAAGKDFNILGMSIPTDTTPGHLGMKKRIHIPPYAMERIRLLESRRHGGVRTGRTRHDSMPEINFMLEKAVMLRNPCPGGPSSKSSSTGSNNHSGESSSSILFMPILGF